MKSWVCSKVTVDWLPAVPGSALREGRVGDVRIFGVDLPGPRWLIWADEATIKLLLKEKNANARLVSEVRKLGESLPSSLPTLSGIEHGFSLEGNSIDIDKDGRPSLAKTRKIGFENDGSELVDVGIQEAVVEP